VHATFERLDVLFESAFTQFKKINEQHLIQLGSTNFNIGIGL